MYVKVSRIAPPKVEPNVTIEMDYETAQVLKELLCYIPYIDGSWTQGLTIILNELNEAGIAVQDSYIFASVGRIVPLMKPTKESV